MQRAKPAVAQKRDAKVKFRPRQLSRNDQPHQHANHPPDDGHDGELPDNFVMVEKSLRIVHG